MPLRGAVSDMKKKSPQRRKGAKEDANFEPGLLCAFAPLREYSASPHARSCSSKPAGRSPSSPTSATARSPSSTPHRSRLFNDQSRWAPAWDSFESRSERRSGSRSVIQPTNRRVKTRLPSSISTATSSRNTKPAPIPKTSSSTTTPRVCTSPMKTQARPQSQTSKRIA